MTLDLDRFVDLFVAAYAGGEWPPPLRRHTGDRAFLRARATVALASQFDDAEVVRSQRMMGSLIIGQAGERAFEEIYADAMQTAEVRLVDDRTRRSDADYILRNGNDRPLYRMNIKLHGSLFQKARDHVGLEPEDCFALATYKIASALDKQDRGHLPYLFVVVTVRGVSAEKIGQELPNYMTEGMLLGKRIISTGKRDLEERFIAAYERQNPDLFRALADRLRSGRWFIFSARRAEKLLKDKLFDRVFALRQPGFNRAFRNAEIDMHLSFSEEMMPLQEFLERSAEISQSQLYSMIERGTI